MNDVRVISNDELKEESNFTPVVHEFKVPIKTNSKEAEESLRNYKFDEDKRLAELLRTNSLKCEWGPNLKTEFENMVRAGRSGSTCIRRYAVIMLSNVVATISSINISSDEMSITIRTSDPMVIEHKDDIYAYPRALKRKKIVNKVITFDLYPKVHEVARGC